MASAPASAEDLPTASTYTRLHITPFDSSLQNLVIPASILPHARNISFHTIETFPEKRFGFVDLPVMDAEKIKKKLNGAVLKGSKMRIETARPESKPEPTPDTDAKTSKKDKEKKKSKKRKHEPDVIEGVQLEGRKVKRGWTTTEQEMIEEKRKKARKDKKEDKSKDSKKDKKDKSKKKPVVKSKYTDEPECLFKTKLPGPSPAAAQPQEADDDDATHKKKRKRKSDREVVVHEFEKTTKYPTFLKSTSTSEGGAEATTFKDGVGWVDSAGNVVEPLKSKRKAEGIPAPVVPKAKKPKASAPAPVPAPQEDDDDDETSSSGSSSSDEDEDDDSSDSDSEDEAPKKSTKTPATPSPIKVNTTTPASTKTDSARPKSAGSVTNLSIEIPPVAKEVHPLEALYKKPAGGDATDNAESKPFSFFGNEDDIEEDDESEFHGPQEPMTPYTRRDMESRHIRSAAPTPDTAHPNRSFNFWAGQDATDEGKAFEDDDDDNDEDDAEEEEQDGAMEGVVTTNGETHKAPVSDFQKQFWEKRGDMNRAWRKRRKTASKEKRYRDNKARAERAI